jgi:hypothetical protein
MVLLSIFILKSLCGQLSIDTVSDACFTIPSPPDDRVSRYCKIRLTNIPHHLGSLKPAPLWWTDGMWHRVS